MHPSGNNQVKIFVVNLKTDSVRKAQMEKHLCALGLQAEFIEAVNGKELQEAQLAELVYDYPRCCLSKGEIGCALSHLGIYRNMVERSIPWALVLEDDARLRPQKDILNELAAHDCRKPTVYLLSHMTDYLPLTRKKLHTCTVYAMYRAYACHGYMLNLAAARKMDEFLRPIRFEADRWELFKLLIHLNIYGVIPHSIDSLDTTKENSSLEKERAFLYRQRSLYRRQMLRKVFPQLLLPRLYYRLIVRLFSKKNPLR